MNSIAQDAGSATSRRVLWVATIGVFSVFVVLSDYGFVNWDFDYFVAARDLSVGIVGDGVRQYVGSQNTPLTQALLVALIGKVVPIDLGFWVAKLPNSLGVALTFYSVSRHLSRIGLSRWPSLVIPLSIVSGPIFAVYGTQASANLLQVGIVSYCFTRMTRWDEVEPSTREILLAAGLFGVALANKYNVILLLPLAFLLMAPALRVGHVRHRLVLMAAFGLVSALPSVAILAWTRVALGVWGSGNTQQYRVGVGDVSSLLLTLSSYLAFIGLFLMPPILLCAIPAGPFSRVLVVSATVVFFFFGSSLGLGELNFGGLESIVAEPMLWRVTATAGFMATLGCGASVLASHRSASMPVRRATCGLLIYVSLHALTRPTQRYMIIVAPLALAFIVGPRLLGRPVARRWLVAMVAMSAILALPAYSFSRAQGNTSDRMAQWLVAEGLETNTHGSIWTHAGQYRVGQMEEESTHEVLSIGRGEEVPADVIHVEEMRVLGFLVRTYAVVPIAAAGG